MAGCDGHVHMREHGIHQDLGLGTRDEHAPLTMQDYMSKRHLARHVLQWLPGTTTHDRIVHARKLVGRERTIEAGVELDAAEARHVGEHPLRREAGSPVGPPLEIADGPVEHAAYGPGLGLHGHNQTARASFSARSAAARASMTSGRRSPRSTPL